MIPNVLVVLINACSPASPPLVVVSEHHDVARIRNAAFLIRQFRSDHGPFTLDTWGCCQQRAADELWGNLGPMEEIT